MNVMAIRIILIFLIISGLHCDSQRDVEESLSDLFEITQSNNIPVPFLPEVLDKKVNIQNITFSKDYRELYYTQFESDTFIMTSKLVSGQWTEPAAASFSGTFCDFEPFISPDGNSLFFVSKRPSEGKSSMKNDMDIWKVNRNGLGWSEPEILDFPVNTDCMEYYPSVSKVGNLYFGRNDSALTRGDIYFSKILHGEYSDPVKLPETVNLPATSYNAYISPDENYIIFSTYILEEEIWHSDLFVCYKNQYGNWGDAVNLGKTINSMGNELSPWVSYDGDYLLFAKSSSDTSVFRNRYNMFWVNTSLIEGFDKIKLKP